MYISDVQEDDLEIAIKVREERNKPDRPSTRHVIFEANFVTFGQIRSICPRSCLFDSLGPFGDSLTDDTRSNVGFDPRGQLEPHAAPRRAAPLGDICAHPGMMIFSGQPRSASVSVKYKGRSRKT